jgi:DNA-binding LacI/PurR family transcriptional regulator
MGKNGPTLEDVARRAGVNRVTVSVVLNNARANTRVSEATRQRILQVAEELHYRPHAIARSLRRQRTDIIGFYYGDNYVDADSPFVASILAGLQRGCERGGKDFLLHNRRPEVSAANLCAELASGKMDGLVLWVRERDPIIQLLAGSRLPVIAIVDPVSALPFVGVDDVMGGILQARHLHERGRRRALYVDRDVEDLTSVVRRRDAFVREAQRLGIAVEICPGTGEADRHTPALVEALARPPHAAFDAAVCWQDFIAHALLDALEQRGRRVPEDVSVLGFDGILSRYPHMRRVTTILAPWRRVAQTAVSQLLEIIEGKEVPQETLLPVELVMGETS